MPSPADVSRRHQRVKEIFSTVLETPEDRRSEVILALCGDDAALREDVESLLGHALRPAVDIVAAASDVHGAIAEVVEASIADHESIVLPERIADYRILALLGRGGMGVVYLAEQDSPRRTVALKVVRGGFAGRQILRRFRREAELLGTLRHPNIAQIYAAGSAVPKFAEKANGANGANRNGRDHGPPVPFFAMEYVRGVPITDFCRERGLAVRDRVALMVPVCNAVQHAHERGIVHRDLKPANVLVELDASTVGGAAESTGLGRGPAPAIVEGSRGATWSMPFVGVPKILDFGIARRDGPQDVAATTTFQTEVGQVVGTLPYMSPEQVSGTPGAVDRRSDVYALGVILYQLLSGRLPLEFGERTIAEAARMVSEVEPTSLGMVDRALRGDLTTIAAKCLEKDPTRRYQGAAELGADLRRYLDDRPIEARPPSSIYQLRKFARRNRGLVTGVVIAFVTLIAATVVAIVLATQAIEARNDARRQLAEATLQNDRSTQSYAVLQQIVAAIEPPTPGGREPTVRETFDSVRARLETLDGDAPEVLGMLLSGIGQGYRRLGDVEAAESLLAASVRNFRAAPADAKRAPVLYIEALMAYADALQARGKKEQADAGRAEACELLEGAIARPEVMADPRLCAGLNYRLGNLRWVRGELAQAADHLDRSVRLYVALDPEGTDFTAAMQSHLASLLMLLGRPQEAEQLHRSALAIHERLRGPDDAQAINVRANIVTVLNQAGRFEEGVDMARQVVADRERLGHDPLFIATAKLNLAFGLIGAGDPQAALPPLREVVALRETILGIDSPDTARAKAILAEALRQLGRLDEAAALATEALRVHRAAHGEINLRVAEDHIELASIAIAQHRCADAIEAATAACDTIEQFVGTTHPLLARALRERGSAHTALGRTGAGEADGEVALLRARELMPPDDPQLADTMLALATTLLHQGTDAARARATALADEGRAILLRSLPHAPWRVAQADAVRGAAMAMAALGRRGDRFAEQAIAGDALLAQSIETIAEKVGPDAPATRAAEALRALVTKAPHVRWPEQTVPIAPKEAIGDTSSR